jgi:hypothetical protein
MIDISMLSRRAPNSSFAEQGGDSSALGYGRV